MIFSPDFSMYFMMYAIETSKRRKIINLVLDYDLMAGVLSIDRFPEGFVLYRHALYEYLIHTWEMEFIRKNRPRQGGKSIAENS
jgi:hypothetical protein